MLVFSLLGENKMSNRAIRKSNFHKFRSYLAAQPFAPQEIEQWWNREMSQQSRLHYRRSNGAINADMRSQ